MTEEDRRLTQIIRAIAERVSGIIDNVQRLSRRERARLERLSLPAWTVEFHAEFCVRPCNGRRARLTVSGADAATSRCASIRISCVRSSGTCGDNALKHAAQDDPEHGVEIPDMGEWLRTRARSWSSPTAGRASHPSTPNAFSSPFTVAAVARDSGCSSPASWRRPMEPRSSTSRAPAGVHGVFRLVFADPRRWEM